MPIAELSDARRIGRDFKVRLGVRVRNTQAGRTRAARSEPMKGTYPTETDYFVLDEAPEDVQKVYGKQPKALRVMLYQEWDARNRDGDELVFNLNNRAYGAQRGLKCKGHGYSAEQPDFAVTSEEAWAVRIEQATGQAAEPLPSTSGDKRYRVRCWGRDCPKYLHLTDQPDPEDPSRTKQLLAPGHDGDASCKAVAILRCVLLHPSTNPDDREHYCKWLGIMELATGSVNSIKDLQSDFDLKVGPLAGRTAGVPLTLVRKPTTTYRGVKSVHWTCALRFDVREIQRWGMIPLSEAFTSDAQRETIKRLNATPLGLTVDSVAGLLPDHLVPEDLRGATEANLTPATDPSRDPAGGVLASQGSQAPPSEPGPFLVRAQLDELKQAAGGLEDPNRPWNPQTNPWRQSSLDRLKAAIVAMNAETGSEVKKFSELRLEHHDWLRERLRSLPPLEASEETTT